MTSEDPKHVIMESLDLAKVEDKDEVLEVRFECGNCQRSIQDVLPEAASGTLSAFSQDRCPNIDCRENSGFHFMGNKAETPDELRELCNLLAKNPKHPTAQTRLRMAELLKERNLKLRFKVKRSARSAATSA